MSATGAPSRVTRTSTAGFVVLIPGRVHVRCSASVPTSGPSSFPGRRCRRQHPRSRSTAQGRDAAHPFPTWCVSCRGRPPCHDAAPTPGRVSENPHPLPQSPASGQGKPGILDLHCQRCGDARASVHRPRPLPPADQARFLESEFVHTFGQGPRKASNRRCRGAPRPAQRLSEPLAKPIPRSSRSRARQGLQSSRRVY